MDSLFFRGKRQGAGCPVIGLNRADELERTNDNTHALRFYQKQGFNLHALRVNALADRAS